ncbi:hypothetical protein BDA99DRAFT_531317 [Phascolomyces articulosus]|uniref:Uncharacterized protein n=1 Tax=Phascolomyces articulosus TaxID=60185 RepID=A0AAD5KRV0_9FUNG|nr:hypothetical protein BDA99DRAFT_531317 [Phascolomyces articulosus]
MHCLHQWCDYDIGSRLRELHLADRPIYFAMVYWENYFHTYHHWKFSSLLNNLIRHAIILLLLVKYCRRIYHIKITGFPIYTSNAVLSLSEASSSSSVSSTKLNIANLEMDMPRDIVLQLENIIDKPDLMSANDHQEVKSILHERGGSLTIGKY